MQFAYGYIEGAGRFPEPTCNGGTGFRISSIRDVCGPVSLKKSVIETHLKGLGYHKVKSSDEWHHDTIMKGVIVGTISLIG